MELTQAIGQLFLLGFKGSAISEDSPIVEDIRRRNLGGVILFDRLLAKKKTANNIKNPSQLKQLTAELQQYAETPLLIAVDQEGGLVARLKPEKGFIQTEKPQILGEADDLTRTQIHAVTTATMLKAVGININLAPCVDLNHNGANPVIGELGRSFGANPKQVAKHCSVWVNEHRKQQILTCLKHFPGHGSSLTDSHLGFTDISKSWRQDELLSFSSLILEDRADCIMTGHLLHSAFDKNHPATLSPAIIQGLLREKLGFDGPVISDDLQMRAITDRYGLAEAACLALAAGVDMLIIGNNLDYDPQLMEKIIPTVVTSIEKGKIPEKRIQQALQRVKALKAKLSSTALH